MAYRDPMTGDELSRLEHFLRQIQVMVRTPFFILFFIAVTAAIWATGNANLLLWWNLCASALAIAIEWLVGTFMWGQTARDAVYIRKIAHLEEQIGHMEEKHGKQLHELKELLTIRQKVSE
jgi:hypothetical protein